MWIAHRKGKSALPTVSLVLVDRLIKCSSVASPTYKIMVMNSGGNDQIKPNFKGVYKQLI